MTKSYKIYESEEKSFGEGKVMKKLVLQGEGDQYPTKGVALWSDHPDYNEATEGQVFNWDLDVKDSKTPNPHGGFYKNRSVLKPDQTPSQAPESPTGDSKVFNYLNLKIEPMLKEILDRQKGEFVESDYPKPKEEGGKEIDPADIPF